MKAVFLSRRLAFLLMVVAGLYCVPAPVLAKDDDEDQADASLKAGDKAPALSIEKWVKGEPVKEFEKGKVYVVEFWATWCGPCRVSMPHLSAMQKQFKDKGVTFIGVDIAERPDKKADDPEAAMLKKVETFVSDQGDRMAYTVAYDGPKKPMDKAYMQAAGQNGIPTAFLIDKTGKIAWIGHPMWLELALEAVVTDKWDPKTSPEQIKKAQKQFSQVAEKVESEPKEALATWEKFAQAYPSVAHSNHDLELQVLVAAGEYGRANKVAGQIVDQAIADKNADMLNDIAWKIVDPEGKWDKKDLDLALRAATKADEFTKHASPETIDTLARVYFLKGDVDKAIELQTKAVDQAKGPAKAELKKSLTEYKDAKAGKKPKAKDTDDKDDD